MKFSATPSGAPNGNRSNKISATPGGGPSFAELIFLNAMPDTFNGSAEALRHLRAMRRSNTANGKFAQQTLSSFPGKGRIK
ncbi:MAG: hypothetical protein ABR568_05675 [Pyrinomonadaceae bacterium]